MQDKELGFLPEEGEEYSADIPEQVVVVLCQHVVSAVRFYQVCVLMSRFCVDGIL